MKCRFATLLALSAIAHAQRSLGQGEIGGGIGDSAPACEARASVDADRLWGLHTNRDVEFARACSQLALAEGLLGRDSSQAALVVRELSETFERSDELRWLSGRVALARGLAVEAFATLNPAGCSWPQQPRVLRDLAVVAAALRQDAIAREAYWRLLQLGPDEERTRIALRLEMAAVLSRESGTGVARANRILADITDSEVDPDSCIWVWGMRGLLNRMDPKHAPPTEASCSNALRWSILLRSSEDVASVFGDIAPAGAWLRLPRSERLCIAAIGLGTSQKAQRIRLWNAVESTASPMLQTLKRMELSRLSGGK